MSNAWQRPSRETILGSDGEPVAVAYYGSATPGGEEYRYRLQWSWAPRPRRTAVFLMLNPSTATELALDPTLKRCRSFAQAWGMGGFVVVNSFALRSTDPDELLLHSAPVGFENDRFIRHACSEADIVVCGWGNHRSMAIGKSPRLPQVLELIREVSEPRCLGMNGDGSPKHPLYVPGTQAPVPYTPTLPPGAGGRRGT